MWDGIFLPKATPAAIVQKLHDAVVAVMDTPAVRERMATIGAELVAGDRRSPEYLHSFVASEVEKWALPIRASGASLD